MSDLRRNVATQAGDFNEYWMFSPGLPAREPPVEVRMRGFFNHRSMLPLFLIARVRRCDIGVELREAPRLRLRSAASAQNSTTHCARDPVRLGTTND